MHHWKHVALLALYIAVGLIVAGMLSATVGGILPAALGGTGSTAAAA